MLAALSAGVIGCGASGGDTIDVGLSELPCESTGTTGIWASNPPAPVEESECLWFLFEANNTYIFEHPLGRVPASFGGTLISFNDDGSAGTPPSGDVFLVIASDESTITIKNGQNQSFFLRLVLQ